VKASIHPHQAERLATLRSFDILDTPRESDFDDIVELASAICRTPIAVVNLIDAERQWFKAEVGLGTRETPLETSICSHIILEQDFTMIEDTHRDRRTCDNELCMPTDGLRFYAGALLKADNGLPIGTLCVLDTKPSTLDAFQQQALKVLARRVMRELELRRALRAQAVLRDEIDHRVKNSLSAVSAAINLYRMEAKKTGDPDGSFDALKRQLDAVSAVHRAIYMSSEGGEVLDLRSYLDVLATALEASLPPGVAIATEAPKVAVSPKIANTVGLIANEFAANTVKYATASQPTTRITFAVSHDDGDLNLTFRNNVPQPDDPDAAAGNGIGARLMLASVRQFGGQLHQEGTAEGFTLTATLPVSSGG
jgi:two-component sensor histidine kinase